MMFAGISRPRLSAAACLIARALLVATPAVCAVAPSAAAAQAADEPVQRAQAALSVLRNAAASQEQHQQACLALIELCELAPARSGLSELIAGPLTAGGASDQIVGTVARMPEAPARLYPLVAQRLAAATPEEMPRLIEAVGSFRTRDAARLLGRYIGDDQPVAVSRAAMAALARLSARDDLTDAAGWTGWLREVEDLNESQWRLRLISALAARNERLAAERQTAVAQLTDSLRKLHLATKAEDRPELLAKLLKNDIPAVRDLGFELVARELSATGHLDGPVGLAALTLLDHSDASVRASAAVLVRQLGPPGAEEAIAKALVAEHDPAAASDLLLAAARWPSPPVVTPVLRWIESGTPAAEAATEAAYWLSRAGELSPGDSERVLAAVRRMPDESLSPASVSLLATLGDDEDRDRLAPLLRSSSAALRQAAGEALLWYPQYRAQILGAASADPDLFDIASRAVMVDDPTAGGLRAVLALPRPSPELARAAIVRMASRVPADELRDVASGVTDPELKRALLTSLTSPERYMSQRDEPPMLAAICSGVGDLAECELSQNRADAALASLDAGSFADGSEEGPRLAALRCVALLALGRVEEAQRLNVGADCWLRGLEMCPATSAFKALAALDAKFTNLSDEQKQKLETLRANIKPDPSASAVGPPTPADPGR
jgi:hypothetical protein